MKRLLGEQGFSLIDMTVGLVLLGIVLLSIYALYRPTFTFSRTVGERLAAQQDVRLAVDRMARALHETTMAPGRLRVYSAEAGCTGAFEGCIGFVSARDADCAGSFQLVAGVPNWQAVLYVWRDTTADELRLHCDTSTTFPATTWPPPTLEPHAVIGTRVVATSFTLQPPGSSSATSVAMAVEEGTAGPAQRAAPKAYLGVFGDNIIEVIDTRTNQVINAIPIPAGPHGLAVTPDGRRVYASSDGASIVSVIDPSADRVIAQIDVGQSPHGLAVTPDGRLLLTAVFGASQVAVIDTARNEVVARVPVGNPHNIAVSPDGQTAYVASQQQGAPALVILDLARRAEVGRVPLDKTPRALSFSPDGKSLYFTLAGVDAVQVLDPALRQVISQIPVGASPYEPLVTLTAYGLVVSQGPGELAIFVPGTSQVTGTVTTGKRPNWIAVNSDGGTAYVTNEGSNTVAVVDLATQRVVDTIPVGNAPRTIVLQPSGAAVRSDVHRTVFNRTVFAPQN